MTTKRSFRYPLAAMKRIILSEKSNDTTTWESQNGKNSITWSFGFFFHLYIFLLPSRYQ